VDPIEKSVGKGGERWDNPDSFEEGSECQHRAKYVPGNLRNGDTDFPISELICFRMSDFKDRSLIRELDVGVVRIKTPQSPEHLLERDWMPEERRRNQP
jgi:hypothetical protein